MFSTDLITYQTVNQTEYPHFYGELITFNNKLTVIAGDDTSKVEVMDKQSRQWNSSRMHSAPLEFKTSRKQIALVVTESGWDILFIFGKLSVMTRVLQG